MPDTRSVKVFYDAGPGVRWGLVKDEEYFFRKGDCNIIARGDFIALGTLFKISSSLLLSGSAFLRKVLRNRDKRQIDTEEKPEDIRALCWAIYKFSPKCERKLRQLVDSPDFPWQRVVSAIYICHKWQFFDHANALLGILFPSPILGAQFWVDESINDSLQNASDHDLAKLSAALKRCQAPACLICLRDHTRTLQDIWLLRIETGSPSTSARLVMDYAQALGLRSFLGMVYYTVLLKQRWINYYDAARSFNMPPAPGPIGHGFMDLSPAQRSALMAGHRSLMNLWYSFRRAPDVPNLPLGLVESHRDECVPAWEEMWDEVAHGHMTPSGTQNAASSFLWDPIGALRQMASRPCDNTSPTGQNTSGGRNGKSEARCHCFFREHARRLERRLLDGLADHFVGGTSTASTYVSLVDNRATPANQPTVSHGSAPSVHIPATPTVSVPSSVSGKTSKKRKRGRKAQDINNPARRPKSKRRKQSKGGLQGKTE